MGNIAGFNCKTLPKTIQSIWKDQDASEDSKTGKALKEMQRRHPFLALPMHSLYGIVKDSAMPKC